MFDWVMLFFDICRLQKGPQDIPYSPSFYYGTILAYSIVGFLLIYIDSDWLDASLQILAGIGSIVVFTKALLWLDGKPERFTQTAAALFGTDALISFLALPALTGMVAGGVSLLAFCAMIFLMIWHWLAIGHIMRHALSESLSFGLGVSFLYLAASYWLMNLLFA
ncbi:MAG: hypothetical protein Kow0065_20550 [Methylomicrobium sp.]